MWSSPETRESRSRSPTATPPPSACWTCAWDALARRAGACGTGVRTRGPDPGARRRCASRKPNCMAPGASTSPGTTATEPASTPSTLYADGQTAASRSAATRASAAGDRGPAPSVDGEHGLTRDAAVEQGAAQRRGFGPGCGHVDRRVELAVGHQRGEVGEVVGAAAGLLQLGEDQVAVELRRVAEEELSGLEGGGLA